MQFYSLEFIILNLILIILMIINFKHKKIMLFAASVLFYLWAGIDGFLFILIYSLMTWGFSKIVNKKKISFVICIIIQLLPLIFIKYITYFVYNYYGIEVFNNIVAPIGISFYSFQSIAYLTDVYKGKIIKIPQYFDFFIFILFFPCVSSGPINRYDVLEQIEKLDNISFEYNRCTNALRYILCGMFMKLFVSERMAILVNSVYGDISSKSGLTLLIASICFTIQIYCDFCGYSYVSYGLAKLYGITVSKNFCNPYHSISITEFWRRWHISLSSWLRDYVYIPLGGNRCTKLKQYRNLVITFVLSGIWHGAGITYAIWGMVHGVALCIEKKFKLVKKENGKFRVFRHLCILAFINYSWIIFRVDSINNLLIITQKIVIESVRNIMSLTNFQTILSFMYGFGISIPNLLMVFFAGVLFIIFEIMINKNSDCGENISSMALCKRWLLYIVMIVVILIFGITGSAGEFIYSKY